MEEFLVGKTVLAFYPGAFTSVCIREMCTFRDSLFALEGLDAQVVGISVDDAGKEPDYKLIMDELSKIR